MRPAFLAFAFIAALCACSSVDNVAMHHPLGGTPEKPSTVRGVVTSLDANLGTLRVQTRTVEGAKRAVGETIRIDENTLFTNSGGGDDLRSWEEITGAEVVIKGWYRDDEYYADEIDVVSFRPNPTAPPEYQSRPPRRP